MLSPKEFENLVLESLALKEEMDRLGLVEVKTSQGVYAMCERALCGVPEQDAYNECRKKYLKNKELIDAYDMIARYELSQRGQNA